jgi:exodeoxyribonuclease VII small subunit
MTDSTQKNMFESTESQTEETLSFEQAFAELEQIVSQRESGQLALETSLAAYKRGDFLLQYCQKYLTEVEQQVQILNERNQLSNYKNDNNE